MSPGHDQPWYKLYDEQVFHKQQGKYEGLDSCDQPSNLTQIGFKS